MFLNDTILVLPAASMEIFYAVTGSVINGTRRGMDNICVFSPPKIIPQRGLGATLTALSSHGSYAP
jgi:hypothetical protein